MLIQDKGNHIAVVELFDLIRIARIGSKAEVHKDCDDKDPRLVFDLEFLQSLPEYVYFCNLQINGENNAFEG